MNIVEAKDLTKLLQPHDCLRNAATCGPLLRDGPAPPRKLTALGGSFLGVVMAVPVVATFFT